VFGGSKFLMSFSYNTSSPTLASGAPLSCTIPESHAVKASVSNNMDSKGNFNKTCILERNCHIGKTLNFTDMAISEINC
jgi:hypothetical protein